MGYSTDFTGAFECEPALNEAQVNYLIAFASTRRVKRNIDEVVMLPDPLREAVGLPVGFEGGFYVGSVNDGFMGQKDDPSILNGNVPPGGGDGYLSEQVVSIEDGGQPGLWCQWVPTSDGGQIEWDEGEKFYGYVPWLAYIIHHFLAPWGVKLNGQVEWAGESHEDRGAIEIVDNTISVYEYMVNRDSGAKVYTP